MRLTLVFSVAAPGTWWRSHRACSAAADGLRVRSPASASIGHDPSVPCRP